MLQLPVPPPVLVFNVPLAPIVPSSGEVMVMAPDPEL